MNNHIFQSYIDNLTQYYGITQKVLFSPRRDYESLEKRRLFFYLCNKKGIPVVRIQKFLQKQGYEIHHSNIVRGIKKMNTVIQSNEDYQKIIKRLEKITVYA